MNDALLVGVVSGIVALLTVIIKGVIDKGINNSRIRKTNLEGSLDEACLVEKYRRLLEKEIECSTAFRSENALLRKQLSDFNELQSKTQIVIRKEMEDLRTTFNAKIECLTERLNAAEAARDAAVAYINVLLKYLQKAGVTSIPLYGGNPTLSINHYAKGDEG